MSKTTDCFIVIGETVTLSTAEKPNVIHRTLMPIFPYRILSNQVLPVGDVCMCACRVLLPSAIATPSPNKHHTVTAVATTIAIAALHIPLLTWAVYGFKTAINIYAQSAYFIKQSIIESKRIYVLWPCSSSRKLTLAHPLYLD